MQCVVLCLLEVKQGEADLIALQRWSHEDHRPHRGHHVVGRDVFLAEIGDNEGRGMKNRESSGKRCWKLSLLCCERLKHNTQHTIRVSVEGFIELN